MSVPVTGTGTGPLDSIDGFRLLTMAERRFCFSGGWPVSPPRLTDGEILAAATYKHATQPVDQPTQLLAVYGVSGMRALAAAEGISHIIWYRGHPSKDV